MSDFKSQWWAARNPPADPKDNRFKDKAVLVTGANSGLGHHAAIKYAALGANPLILAVRTQGKGEKAKADIIRATGCSPDIFKIFTVDLSTFASVKAFVDQLNKEVPKLHVAQLVAGVCPMTYKASPDGYEMSLQVNVLSTALMSILLLPRLVETGRVPSPDGFVPHISLINSIASLEVDEKDVPPGESVIQSLNNESTYDLRKSYFVGKLASWYIILGLIDRLKTEVNVDKVIVNASCPGLCKTDMGRDFPVVAKMFMNVKWAVVGRSAEQGARTLVSATAVGPESNGKLWTNDKYAPPSKLQASGRGTELYHETWEEILSILRKHVNSDLI